MSKVLHLTYADGERRTVTEDGRITRENMHGTGGRWAGSPDWIFLGFSFHPWRQGIDARLADVLADPTLLRQVDARGRKRPLIGWDRDHGTVRQNVCPHLVGAYVNARED